MKQKYWARITVVFFSLMLLLTIFSRATESVSKAKVTVAKASRQTISHEIQLNGTVEAQDYFLQYVPSGLMVKSVRISLGQQVEIGDVLFTVDTQKLQEKISGLEAEIDKVAQQKELSISRAEEDYQKALSGAEEEKALAYQDYLNALDAYNEYVNARGETDSSYASDTGEMVEDSSYDTSVAGELESAMQSAKSAYEAVVREQDKVVESAGDSLQQTKEDLDIEDSAGDLKDSLKELQPYLENGGQYLAEYSGVVEQIAVESGVETAAGVALLLTDSAGSVRFEASLSGEDKDSIKETSIITLMGEDLSGEEASYVVSNAAISKNNAAESGGTDEYSLTLDIPGSLFPVGSSILAVIDNHTAEYDNCVPLQCLRQNGNYQYFIYVTEEQETVLGKEIVAREMTVTVLDKNEKYAAIEETISGDVIVSSSKEISDGSRVIIIE